MSWWSFKIFVESFQWPGPLSCSASWYSILQCSLGDRRTASQTLDMSHNFLSTRTSVTAGLHLDTTRFPEQSWRRHPSTVPTTRDHWGAIDDAIKEQWQSLRTSDYFFAFYYSANVLSLLFEEISRWREGGRKDNTSASELKCKCRKENEKENENERMDFFPRAWDNQCEKICLQLFPLWRKMEG